MEAAAARARGAPGAQAALAIGSCLGAGPARRARGAHLRPACPARRGLGRQDAERQPLRAPRSAAAALFQLQWRGPAWRCWRANAAAN